MSEPTRTATQDVSATQQAPVPGLLIVHHGERAFVGSAAPIPDEGALVLGREGEGFAPEALQDGRISRRHAEIRKKGKGLVLKDLDSHNGTTVNGKAVKESPLRSGDIIGLGRVLLLVIAMDPERLRSPHPRLVGCSAALGRAIRTIEQVATRARGLKRLG